MIIKHFDVPPRRMGLPPQPEGWEATWYGYHVMTKCYSDEKRRLDAERDAAIHAEGMITEPEFKQHCLLSVLADIDGKNVNVFELGAGWGRICLEVAGVIDHRVIPLAATSYRCLAIEAEPTHYAWAKEHFEAHHINGDVVHGAVSNSNGRCWFDASEAPDTCYGQAINPILGVRKGVSFGGISNVVKGKAVRVPVYTVDRLVETHGFEHVDLIHIDVQGAEYKVIQGAQESIKKDLIDYLFVGTHDAKLNDALRELLSSRFDTVVDIYPRSLSTVDGFPPIRFHDGCQIYRRKNIRQ